MNIKNEPTKNEPIKNEPTKNEPTKQLLMLTTDISGKQNIQYDNMDDIAWFTMFGYIAEEMLNNLPEAETDFGKAEIFTRLLLNTLANCLNDRDINKRQIVILITEWLATTDHNMENSNKQTLN